MNITREAFNIKTASGKEMPLPMDALFYRGIVKNDPNSFAALSIYKSELRILIADRGGNYVVAKTETTNEEYILYNDHNLKVERQLNCGTSDSEIVQQNKALKTTKRSRMKDKCVEVYLEAEFALFNSQGGLDSTINYVLSLFHEVATLFFNESINIQPFASVTVTI